jgi:predicted Zn-dependent peptidase
MKMKKLAVAVILLFLFSLTCFAADESYKALEKRVQEKTLSNGLKVLILQRTDAPVASFVIYANVGGVNEQQNATGLAHIFEHMAFKGTKTIGTKDYTKEKEAMDKEDIAFMALRAERIRQSPDPEKVKVLEENFKKAGEEAQKWVETAEYDKILEREGAQQLNAFTAFDQTVYFYSMTSNKLELWAALEADRFTNPVLHEFYKEKDVIMEEKRMGESSPMGRLFDDFFPMAYKAHMYRSWVIGNMEDLRNMTREQAAAWFRKNYSAKNLTAVIVGDIDPETAFPVLEKYLGKIPAGERPEPPITVEPPQRAEKRMIMEDPSQPFLVIGYHRPAVTDKDDAVYAAIADILGGGRSSRLYTSLVKEKKLAMEVNVMPTFEGEKYPGIFTIMCMPNKGVKNEDCEKAIYEELKKIETEKVTDDELKGVKARAKTTFLDGIDNNLGLGIQLAFAENVRGSWHEMFKALDRIDAVSQDEITRVSKDLFKRTNRVVAMIETTIEEE